MALGEGCFPSDTNVSKLRDHNTNPSFGERPTQDGGYLSHWVVSLLPMIPIPKADHPILNQLVRFMGYFTKIFTEGYRLFLLVEEPMYYQLSCVYYSSSPRLVGNRAHLGGIFGDIKAAIFLEIIAYYL